MTTLLTIIAALAIGLGVGLMNKESANPKKLWKPKKRLFSDAEMDYGKLHFK